MRFHLAATVPLLVLACGLGCSREEPPSTEAPQTRPQTAAELSPDEREQLEVLGYVNAVPVSAADADKSGVTLHDSERAFEGLNFFNARNESAAKLMDMDGSVLHRWASDAKGATWDALTQRLPGAMPGYTKGWNHVELLRDGGILAIGSHHALLRLDRDSKLLWKLEAPVHHDVSIAPSGDILVLADGIRTAEIAGEPVAFQDNLVLVVSAEGEIERSYSLFDAMAAPKWKPLFDLALRRIARVSRERLVTLTEQAKTGGAEARELARLYIEAASGDVGEDEGIKNVLFHNQVEDIFHANSVQVLHSGEPGLWRAGDLLVSLLRMDMIVVLDQDSGELIWSWGRGRLEEAHHATQLPGGDILVFDNGARRGYSRILRVAPATGKAVWKYQAVPPERFYSFRRGGAQALPNGNVLIANTDSGQAFEVTPEGDVVWEFFSDYTDEADEADDTESMAPAAGTDSQRQRAAIYRMERVARDSVASWLESSPGSGDTP